MKKEQISKKFSHKHKSKVIRGVGALCVIVVFVFAIPIAINWAYDQPAWLSILAVSWEAKDALSFYGSILGAAATIFVLQQTIKFTVKSQKEERKLTVKPYLQSSRYHYNDASSIPDEEDIVYLNVSQRGTTYQGALPHDISFIKKIHNKLLANEKIDDMDQALYKLNLETFAQKKYVFAYDLINCGAGNAINVNLKINNRPTVGSFCVTTTAPKKFMFILNNDLLDTDNSEFSLRILLTYTDIAATANYYQTEEIIFTYKDDKYKTIQKSGEILTKPQEIPMEYDTERLS